MMNVYLRVLNFSIDNKIVKTECHEILIDDKDVLTEEIIDGQGTTFDSLWDYMGTAYKGLNVPANRWERAFWSKKRRIEFFVKAKTWIDNGTERPWKITMYDKPYSISMSRLMKFDADKVAQYLVERNLKIGVDK